MVTNKRSMFNGASSFNQDIGSWDIGKVTTIERMLDRSGLSLANYDQTLTGWADQEVQANVPLGASGLTYCSAEAARQRLIDEDSWGISGDT